MADKQALSALSNLSVLSGMCVVAAASKSSKNKLCVSRKLLEMSTHHRTLQSTHY